MRRSGVLLASHFQLSKGEIKGKLPCYCIEIILEYIVARRQNIIYLVYRSQIISSKSHGRDLHAEVAHVHQAVIQHRG